MPDPADHPRTPDPASDPAADQVPPHMLPDQFRALGHRMVDEVADYWQSIAQRPVRPPTQPGDVLAALPETLPQNPGGDAEWDAIFDDVRSLITPNLTHWQHPGFLAYFPCSASGPAILGELLSAGLNVNGMLWATSPAVTELETRMLDWCADLFGLPGVFKSTHTDGTRHGGGVIQGTASEATLAALVAARHRARDHGHPDHQSLAVYCSDQAHSSVAKAAVIAGLAAGPDDAAHIRVVRTDHAGAMDPTHFAEMIATDRTAHASDPTAPLPAAVVATVGTTGTGAVDPVPEIAEHAQANDGLTPWIHIDAAWAGPAAACPEHRDLLAGAAHADSICLNPHKWMLTNFDCDLFWVRDREALISALSITPEYLRNAPTDAGAVIDYRDWHVPLGRRFRALKLWFVLRHYGAEGVRAHVRRHIAWTEWLEARLRDDRRFEMPCPRSLSLLTFTLAGDEDGIATRDLMERVNATGRFLLSHTTFRGRYIIRVSIGATTTEFHHIEDLWSTLDQLA